MKEINIRITEDLFANYNITVPEIADLAGYNTKVINEDYVQAIGNPTIPNPDYIQPVYETNEDGSFILGEGGFPQIKTPAVGEPEIPNPDYIPAVGETEIDNPETMTVFLAKKILQNGIGELVNKAIDRHRNVLRASLSDLDMQERQIVEDIKIKAEISTVD